MSVANQQLVQVQVIPNSRGCLAQPLSVVVAMPECLQAQCTRLHIGVWQHSLLKSHPPRPTTLYWNHAPFRCPCNSSLKETDKARSSDDHLPCRLLIQISSVGALLASLVPHLNVHLTQKRDCPVLVQRLRSHTHTPTVTTVPAVGTVVTQPDNHYSHTLLLRERTSQLGPYTSATAISSSHQWHARPAARWLHEGGTAAFVYKLTHSCCTHGETIDVWWEGGQTVHVR